MNSDTELFVNI